MTPRYTYISSADFVKHLTFSYVETYSFQRGAEYELQQKMLAEDYDHLQSRKSKLNDLTPKEEERLLALAKLCGFTRYLIDENNQLHYSARKTNSFSSTDLQAELLKDIFKTEINDVPAWMCAPIYRDAFVFYNIQDEIIGVLNVCLSCQYMETTKFNHINADYKTYDLLKRFFIDIGHDVEDPEHSILDDLNKLKSTYKN